ncbi:hypothetical protein CsSME_00041122 [Camellia sinensis var. sinensis]
MALPKRGMEIADPSLLLEVGADDDHIIEIAKTKECLVAVLTIGVSCSMESLGEQMHMRDVVEDVLGKQWILGKKNNYLQEFNTYVDTSFK